MFKSKSIFIVISAATSLLLSGCSSDSSSALTSSISGQVIDGYWVGDKFCVDRNDSQECDPEPISLTKDYPVMISMLGLEAVENLLDNLDDGINVTEIKSGKSSHASVSGVVGLSNNSGNIFDLSKENMETMVLGAQINMSESTFQNKPIFDVSLLKKNGFADVNDQSAAEAVSSTVFSSSTTAESASSNIRSKTGASLNFFGFKFGSTYTHEEQTSNYNSDGESYLTMMYTNTGGYAIINTENFAGGNSLEDYLIGSKISGKDLAKYVHLIEDKDGHYTSLEIDKTLELKNYDYNSNPYGVIQQLTELEYTFDKLKSQYDDLKILTEKSPSEEKLLTKTKYMLNTLRGNINDSIDKFYSTFGTHFVSRIDLAAYGKGSGVLKVSQNAANKEVINGGGAVFWVQRRK